MQVLKATDVKHFRGEATLVVNEVEGKSIVSELTFNTGEGSDLIESRGSSIRIIFNYFQNGQSQEATGESKEGNSILQSGSTESVEGVQ